MSPSPNFYQWHCRSTKKSQVGPRSSQLCTPYHWKSREINRQRKQVKKNKSISFDSTFCSLNPNTSTLLNKNRKNPEWIAFRKEKTLHKRQYKWSLCRWKFLIIWTRVIRTIIISRLAMVILCLTAVTPNLSKEAPGGKQPLHCNQASFATRSSQAVPAQYCIWINYMPLGTQLCSVVL